MMMSSTQYPTPQPQEDLPEPGASTRGVKRSINDHPTRDVLACSPDFRGSGSREMDTTSSSWAHPEASATSWSEQSRPRPPDVWKHRKLDDEPSVTSRGASMNWYPQHQYPYPTLQRNGSHYDGNGEEKLQPRKYFESHLQSRSKSFATPPQMRLQFASNKVSSIERDPDPDRVVVVPGLFGDEQNMTFYYDLLDEIREMYASDGQDLETILNCRINSFLVVKGSKRSQTFTAISDRLCEYFKVDKSSAACGLAVRKGNGRAYPRSIAPRQVSERNVLVCVSFGTARDLSFHSSTGNEASRHSGGGAEFHLHQPNNCAVWIGQDLTSHWMLGCRATVTQHSPENNFYTITILLKAATVNSSGIGPSHKRRDSESPLKGDELQSRSGTTPPSTPQPTEDAAAAAHADRDVATLKEFGQQQNDSPHSISTATAASTRTSDSSPASIDGSDDASVEDKNVPY